MEPISAVASIFTVLGAGGKISDGLKKLSDLRNAPHTVLKLNNEVVDFCHVVSDIENLVHDYNGSVEVPRSLAHGLERAKRRLLELESFIAYELMTPSTDADQALRVDRSRLLRAESKILSLQQGIRDEKLALVAGLSILNRCVEKGEMESSVLILVK